MAFDVDEAVCVSTAGADGADAGRSASFGLFDVAPDIRPIRASWLVRPVLPSSDTVEGRASSAAAKHGISAPLSRASVRWCAVSAGVRPVGKGKVSKQVVGV